jgi:dipeptide/tripeptide permease
MGPPLAGFLADRQGGFTMSLLLAAAVVAVGGALVATDSRFSAGSAPDKT